MTPERWRQIKVLFQAALEADLSHRAGLLDEAGAGDPSLRKEIEALLKSHEQATSFLESPTLEVVSLPPAEDVADPIVGQRIGPYEILREIGRGGMGEVYRARDSRLDRIDALKILPLEVASDPDRLHRFIREAKAASALNHPNIATIYEIGESDAIHWIAMELVEGETLEERMKGKPLEVSEILDICFQVAEGLEAAHRKGILHRDIKPANIMLTPQGQVKVLDFGLAKRVRQEKPAGQTVVSTESETTPGLIMGTVEYMSPEQVLGHEVDQRTDLYSLGVVLYSMVTGRLPFRGASSTDTMYKILHVEPEAIVRSTGDIPIELKQIIRKCLEKDRGLRYQHASELCIDLKRLKRDSDSERVAALGVSAKPLQQAMKAIALSRRWKWVVLSVVLLLLVGIGITWYEKRHLESPADTVLTPIPLTWYPGSEYTPSFSPDGTQVAFQWCTEAPGENCDIYIKQIGVEPPFQLTSDPAFEWGPAWSPDGRFIAFYRRNAETRKAALMLIPQRGGQERKLVESDGGYIPAWTPDSKWLVFSWRETNKANPGLFLISVETEEKRKLTSPPDPMSDIDAAVSPDGHTLAFTRGRGISFDIYLLPLAEGCLPQGKPEKIAKMGEQSNWAPAWTPDGNEIVFLSHSASGIGFWRVAMSNPTKPRRIVLASSDAGRFALSRQGNRLAYQVSKGGNNDIWKVDVRSQRNPVPLISSTRDDMCPAYSPDGKKIAFYSDRSGQPGIWVCNSDGSSPTQLTSYFGDPVVQESRWSPDGQSIAFTDTRGGNMDIFAIGARGGAARRLTTDPASDRWPYWSRDGQSIYFASRRSGSCQIWKMPAVGGAAVQITPNGGGDRDLPQESPDGKYIYYLKIGPPFSVWRMPIGGGQETMVLDSFNEYYAVWEQGIYFLSGPRDINLYEFSTNKISKIVTIEPGGYAGAFAVSPDSGTILYPRSEPTNVDLMLVENFR